MTSFFNDWINMLADDDEYTFGDVLESLFFGICNFKEGCLFSFGLFGVILKDGSTSFGDCGYRCLLNDETPPSIMDMEKEGFRSDKNGSNFIITVEVCWLQWCSDEKSSNMMILSDFVNFSVKRDCVS